MKNIVVCCDGTGNEYGTNNTNVVAAYELAEESARQCRYGACGMNLDEDALPRSRHQGDPLGKMHESFTGFWRIRGSRRRTIPNRAYIHRSVVTRMSDPGSSYVPRLPDDYTVVE